MKIPMACFALCVIVTASAVPTAQVAGGAEPARAAKEKAAAVERARTRLSARLGVAAGAIDLESVSAATWPDASLGCPEKHRLYAQVVTEGYRVTLKTGGRPYQVHVAGGRAVLCDPAGRQ